MEVINLNFIPSGANPVAHASQFDEGRTTRFNLFDGSAVYTLDGTEIITVSVRKPDGHIVTEAVTNTSSTYVEVVTTEQMTACAGDNLAQIKVEKGGDTIGFLNYILQVQKDPEDGGDPSASFIHDLNEQIAEAVADQYDAADVVFDAVPTAGHGVGFAVTSEGVKNAIPDELEDLSDVTYTGTPAMGEAVVWDGSKWTNGTPDMDVSDLADVTITTPSDDEILVYDNGEWVNKANPASTANFGADYDENTTYNTGDKVIYNNLFYECNDDGVTGAWDATKWDSLTVADMTAGNLPLGSDFSDPNSTAYAVKDLQNAGYKKITRTQATATTASNGSVSLSLNPDTNPVLNVIPKTTNGDVYAVIVSSTSNQYAVFYNLNGQVVASTSVSFNVVYATI